MTIEALDLFWNQGIHSARGILRIRLVDVTDTRCEMLKIEDLLVISIPDNDDVSSVRRQGEVDIAIRIGSRPIQPCQDSAGG